MSDGGVSVGNVVAMAGWVFSVLFMLAGSVVGLATERSWLTSMLLAWGLFLSAASATLTLKECTRGNRRLFREAMLLMADIKSEDDRSGSVAKIR